MGQKHSSSEVADSEIAMTNRTDLSSHFTSIMSKSYQADECFNCGAALEDSNLFNSSRSKKSSGEVTVRCQQCRVCESTNVILEKFRAVIASSPRSIPIVPSGNNASSQSYQTNYPRSKSLLDTANNTTTSTFTEPSSSFV